MCEINGVVEPVDINFALLTDMMYKKRLKPGDLDDVSEEDQAKMDQLYGVTPTRVTEETTGEAQTSSPEPSS
jgi:hypothetical protein